MIGTISGVSSICGNSCLILIGVIAAVIDIVVIDIGVIDIVGIDKFWYWDRRHYQ